SRGDDCRSDKLARASSAEAEEAPARWRAPRPTATAVAHHRRRADSARCRRPLQPGQQAAPLVELLKQAAWLVKLSRQMAPDSSSAARPEAQRWAAGRRPEEEPGTRSAAPSR